MPVKFRFEDMEIWTDSIVLSDDLLDLADLCDTRRLHRFGEKLRGACLSISNNIAEGAGTEHRREFKQFLNYARRSFECANMLFILERRALVSRDQRDQLLDKLDHICRKIYRFKSQL